jgi:hypothetical protein
MKARTTVRCFAIASVPRTCGDRSPETVVVVLFSGISQDFPRVNDYAVILIDR